MKSFVATMCVFVLAIVSFGTALAGVVEDSGNTDPDTFYDSLDESGDEIYLENGSTTLIFDKATGNLTYWSDASGAVLADTPSDDSKSATDTATDSPESLLLDAGTNRSECDIWSEQNILIDVINWNGDCNPQSSAGRGVKTVCGERKKSTKRTLAELPSRGYMDLL
ncbi:MAG: hypothetical protein IT350_12750 [Deltaproteobacteria bacterium]|nr:hypothetical protein [Deltaproteobacteria bacterium]